MNTQQQFLDVLPRDEAERRFRARLDLSPLEGEPVPLEAVLGRILAADVAAPRDVPAFDRSNMDGFAVQAASTFGASEDRPLLLRLNAEAIVPGMAPRQQVAAGHASSIATGGMIPRGADAVVMVEHTDLRGGMLAIARPVAPGANISWAGTDIGMGETVLRQGERLSSREAGVLAALGLPLAHVVRKPRVAILSTGDEIRPPGADLPPGCVHDSNSTVLAGAVRELGGEPVPLGIVDDDDDALDAALRRAMDCDCVLLSGGTSKGAGDLSYRAVARLGPPGIVAHGVALKPGKPLCLAVVDRQGRRPLPLAVLPGFPTSAIFTFHEFLAPVLRLLAGQPAEAAQAVQAVLPLRVNSERGRTEYLLVGLVEPATPGPAIAYPMGKGSGSVTAFGRADAFVAIPRQREWLEAGERVEARLLAGGARPAGLVAIGSHCVGLDFLLNRLSRRGIACKSLAVGSTGGLEAARRGECDVAGVHLLDPDSDCYNLPFLGPGLELVGGYGRMQGVVFRKGDERFEGQAPEVVRALPECVMANRNRGSGTRILVDRLLGEARPPGYLAEAKSHNAVAAAVAQGRADWGVAIRTVADALGLGFLPLREERYDFVLPVSRKERPGVRAFLALLAEPQTRAALAGMGFSP